MKRIIKAMGRLLLMGALLAGTAHAADTIKVGVLHSLSGTMAISETSLKDITLMTIEEINAEGGLLARNSKPWLWIRPPTGRCLPKRPGS